MKEKYYIFKLKTGESVVVIVCCKEDIHRAIEKFESLYDLSSVWKIIQADNLDIIR